MWPPGVAGVTMSTLAYPKKPFYCVTLQEFVDYARHKMNKMQKSEWECKQLQASIENQEEAVEKALDKAKVTQLMMCTPKMCNEAWSRVIALEGALQHSKFAEEYTRTHLEKRIRPEAHQFMAGMLLMPHSLIDAPGWRRKPLYFNLLPQEIRILILHYLFEHKCISKRALTAVTSAMIL
jgi:hypothetical protein